jgi:CAAX protease family protein
MSQNDNNPGKAEFFFFELTDSDLPFYRGVPVGLGPIGWGIVLLSVAIAYMVLSGLQPRFHSGLAGFIPPLLFVIIPLATLAVVAGSRAPFALFKPIHARDLGIIFGFFILNAIVTIALGYLIIGLFHSAPNPAAQLAAAAIGFDRVLFLGWVTVQLVGEEILTILCLLAFMALLDRFVSRKAAMCIAVLGASIIFAMIHLPTYQGNVAQALVGLVPIRIVLLMPFLITRNLWASTGTHVLNDWAIFSLPMIAGASQ